MTDEPQPASPEASTDDLSFFDVVTTTRAIRRYRPDPVTDDDLARMLFAATRAPSGSNRQPFRFLVLRDGPSAREARRLLGESFRSMWADKRAADGYDAGSGGDPTSAKGRMAATMQHFVDHVEDVPAIVLACYRRHRPPHPTEGASLYPACQNLLLAARALGYGGVMTIWHAAVEDDLKAALGMPDDAVIGATITLGRPAGRHGPVRRRPLSELVYEDRWEQPAPWAVRGGSPPKPGAGGRSQRPGPGPAVADAGGSARAKTGFSMMPTRPPPGS